MSDSPATDLIAFTVGYRAGSCSKVDRTLTVPARVVHMTFGDEVDALGDDAYEALRAIAHRAHRPIPPAEAYQIIGSLKRTPHLLPQLFIEIARGLVESLDRFEITEDLERPLEEGEEVPDPAVKITTAAEHLMKAAKLSAQAGLELEKAQTAVATQSHRECAEALEPAEEA